MRQNGDNFSRSHLRFLLYQGLNHPKVDWPYHDLTQTSFREQPMADPVLVNVDYNKNLLQHSFPLH